MSRSKTIEDYMAEVIKSAPGETQRGWELLAWRAHETDVAMRRAFFNYGVANYFKSHEVEAASPDEIAIRKRERHYKKSAAATRPRTRSDRKQKSEREQQRTVIGLTMFRWVMQQKCGTLAKMGGAYADLAKCGKANQVLGTRISTVQARDVFRRNGVEVPGIIPAEGPAQSARAA